MAISSHQPELLAPVAGHWAARRGLFRLRKTGSAQPLSTRMGLRIAVEAIRKLQDGLGLEAPIPQCVEISQRSRGT